MSKKMYITLIVCIAAAIVAIITVSLAVGLTRNPDTPTPPGSGIEVPDDPDLNDDADKPDVPDDDDQDDDTIVTPVDDSFAAAINGELNTAQKNTLTITADSNLEAILNKVADKFDDHALQGTAGDIVTAFVLDSESTVPQDARHLMGLGDDASLTTTTGAGSQDPDGNAGKNGNVGAWTWKYFAKNDSVETTLDFIIVDGGQTEEGLAHEVADELKALMTENRMPGEAVVGNEDYDYDYTGHVASIKLDNLRGDESFYVVAVEITKTPTEVVNAHN